MFLLGGADYEDGQLAGVVLGKSPGATFWAKKLLLRLGIGGALRGQFGPDALPIVGAHLSARDFAAGSALDLNAALRRYRAFLVRPLVDEHRRDGKLRRQFALGGLGLDVLE